MGNPDGKGLHFSSKLNNFIDIVIYAHYSLDSLALNYNNND